MSIGRLNPFHSPLGIKGEGTGSPLGINGEGTGVDWPSKPPFIPPWASRGRVVQRTPIAIRVR